MRHEKRIGWGLGEGRREEGRGGEGRREEGRGGEGKGRDGEEKGGEERVENVQNRGLSLGQGLSNDTSPLVDKIACSFKMTPWF